MAKKFRLGDATKMLADKDRPSDPEDDPFAALGEPSGDLETDAIEEIDAIAAGFRARQAQEGDRFRRAVDTEYWFAVGFLSREHKERFLAQIPGPDPTAGGDGQRVDGHLLAKALGINIEPPS